MPSNRDEGHLLYDMRLNKYTINNDEKRILQKIFYSIKLDIPLAQQIAIDDNDFIPSPEHGYVALAKKFKQQIEAVERYNKDIEQNHPVKNFFGYFFKKDPVPLKTALTFINKYTHSRITLNNIETAVNYSRDEKNKHAHKSYTFADDTSYQFTSKNLLTTLTANSKKFLFWAYGPIAELKNVFSKKVESAKRDRKTLKITENKPMLLQNIQSDPDSILTKFPADRKVSRKGIIQHYELQNAITTDMLTSVYVTKLPEYAKIIELFNNTLPNYDAKNELVNNDRPIFKFINNAKEIINTLNEIITHATNALATLNQQRIAPNVERPVITDKDFEFFQNIINIGTQDIKAIKAFSGSYTRYMIFSDNYVSTEQKQRLYKEDIISLDKPADRLLRI